ncbi:hypothetical protein DZF91_14725 [Actinomadura logoneensis]|uniref:Uncharacterized protein n=1 Tax=Actinomadura logoneensis TaxID=2293572 RepID=A0A372JM66_9ACTN|nr:hypothetical protein [Actinomadura logoneensis]RFU40884.1 hypothetical protein DZF91_14725 [Actinomadura logoneensis]
MRDKVQASLGAAERTLISDIARSYERLAAMFGLRLRPGLGMGYDDRPAQVSATMRGFVLTALSLPPLGERRVRPGVLGASETTEWSPPALAIAATVLSLLEPDPRVTWDDGRLAAVRAEIRAV